MRLVGEPGVTAKELYVRGFDEAGMCYGRMILDPETEVLVEDLWPGDYVMEAWNTGRAAWQPVTVRSGGVTVSEVRIHPPVGPPRTEAGTITVVEAGTRRAPESGWVEFYLCCEGGSVLARVEDGRWSVALGEWGDLMAVSRMELDGRPAHADPVHFLFEEYWNGTEFAIDARYTPKTVLEVVDVVTRRRIPHVEVHAVEEQRYGQDDAILPPDHPARPLAGRPSVETRSNPMELANWIEEGWFPDWQPVRKWWIRAPGYAWKRVEIDHTVGGRIVVELAPRR